MKLYLARHAIAVPHGTPGIPDDSKRPLTPEGLVQARRSAKGLKKIKPKMDAVFSSPYVRAIQTAEQIARVYGEGIQIREMPELRPDIPPAETSKALKTLGILEQAVFVGHEPHLTAWIEYLTGGTRCLMKKGGVACVELEELRPVPPKGVLRWLMTPKQLDKVAG